MKVYTKHNFFKHTYCEFQQVSDDFFKEKSIHYKSKSGSQYFYTEEGVYRKSNHWGRVADCQWKIENIKAYKNQRSYIGFAKWTQFYPLNTLEKTFYIQVDYDFKKVKIVPINIADKEGCEFLFTALEAQKRVKQINDLFSEYKWASYYHEDIDVLREKIINQLIGSNKKLQHIKFELKK